MASEACPVCCLILNVETPARVALVAKPARRLCPEYPAGSNPAVAIRSRRIKDTASRLAEADATVASKLMELSQALSAILVSISFPAQERCQVDRSGDGGMTT